ncbi:hypothetical protein AM493_05635 [Flavobacterium akiainvivens]|uniref:Sigma-54 factor interaction domain-containing protein n=1 Tax=Flavobacterium akiainvivens TaxID=1202724 RepID=A0A0N0RQK5_9FLAO|nr:sigma 54-interacting transcriptional regulator [Flavobacterium akiainvivens]KOS05572.1 hypothetical protein AM493_05635 [Flavobacterium akiainvivens]SFQ34547.1 formate hydrogenlyase transcriptional activator [Flavobacterium akiainvivens]
MQHKNPEADALVKAMQERERAQLLQLSLCTALSQVTDRNSLQPVIQQLKQHIGFDAFAICTTNAAEKDYAIFFHDNPKAQGDLKGAIHKVEDGYFNTTLQSAEPIAFNLVSATAKNLPVFMLREKQSAMREAVALPLHYHKNNPSVLFLFFKNPRGFTPDARKLLRGLTMQLALTVSNILVTEKIAQYGNAIPQSHPAIPTPQNTANGYAAIIGQSPAMQSVINLVKQVAPSDTGVLLLGESGTGKEVIAGAIHNNSARSGKDMIRVNCAAIPANLIESELFGHEKGSFTGAVTRRIGKFEQANNSTLFLDEIGELPLNLQTKLLRVLQESELERIGGSKTIKVNVRIIAASNLNLNTEVAEGRFRADLFYRLNIFPITLPALRERIADLPELAQHFITSYCEKENKKAPVLSAKALHFMELYPWPGNVRELKHTLERAVLLASKTITEEHLPALAQPQPTPVQHIKTLEEVEKDHILNVIRLCGGRISGTYGAAAQLGIPPGTLTSRMQKLGIKKGFNSK